MYLAVEKRGKQSLQYGIDNMQPQFKHKISSKLYSRPSQRYLIPPNP